MSFLVTTDIPSLDVPAGFKEKVREASSQRVWDAIPWDLSSATLTDLKTALRLHYTKVNNLVASWLIKI